MVSWWCVWETNLRGEGFERGWGSLQAVREGRDLQNSPRWAQRVGLAFLQAFLFNSQGRVASGRNLEWCVGTFFLSFCDLSQVRGEIKQLLVYFGEG